MTARLTAENSKRNPLSRYQKALLLLFLFTLPLANPWVRGDGVGYYAYIRSLLIDGDLNLENEWLAANPSFVMNRVGSDGRLQEQLFTETGNVRNLHSVGSSILWAPFLSAAHLGVLTLNVFGVGIPADGYSTPYVVTMALATALYGFVGLWLAFALASKYFEERWGFLSTVGIWFASSLPVYMYFNPSWSHAHSAFVIALFLWYWERTRQDRSVGQWVVLGLIAGLMMNVYYPNAVVLLVPLLESLRSYWEAQRSGGLLSPPARRLFGANLLFAVAVLAAFSPTLITRKLIYGSYLSTGYYQFEEWQLSAPARWEVLFSANHGLFSWTPILLPAVLGLIFLWRKDRELAVYLGSVFLVFYYVIACYPAWHGISSFGNRFFVSLTPLYVVGLAASLDALQRWADHSRRSLAVAGGTVALLIAWNLGFIFQWGMQMIPNRGPVSWSVVAHNQVAVVPGKFFGALTAYFQKRDGLMKEIEKTDVQELRDEQETKKNLANGNTNKNVSPK